MARGNCIALENASFPVRLNTRSECSSAKMYISFWRRPSIAFVGPSKLGLVVRRKGQDIMEASMDLYTGVSINVSGFMKASQREVVARPANGKVPARLRMPNKLI